MPALQYREDTDETLRQQQQQQQHDHFDEQRRYQEAVGANYYYGDAQAAARLQQQEAQRLHDRLLAIQEQQQQQLQQQQHFRRFPCSPGSSTATSPQSPARHHHQPIRSPRLNVKVDSALANQFARTRVSDGGVIESQGGKGTFSRRVSPAQSLASSPSSSSRSRFSGARAYLESHANNQLPLPEASYSPDACGPFCKLALSSAHSTPSGGGAGKSSPWGINKDGETHLHIAARHGHHSCCMALIATGADPRIKDYYNDTPAAVANAAQFYSLAADLNTKALMM
jgi:hypothetical protein